jgi:hypothetical protein
MLGFDLEKVKLKTTSSLCFASGIPKMGIVWLLVGRLTRLSSRRTGSVLPLWRVTDSCSDRAY